MSVWWCLGCEILSMMACPGDGGVGSERARSKVQSKQAARTARANPTSPDFRPPVIWLLRLWIVADASNFNATFPPATPLLRLSCHPVMILQTSVPVDHCTCYKIKSCLTADGPSLHLQVSKLLAVVRGISGVMCLTHQCDNGS